MTKAFPQIMHFNDSAWFCYCRDESTNIVKEITLLKFASRRKIPRKLQIKTKRTSLIPKRDFKTPSLKSPQQCFYKTNHDK